MANNFGYMPLDVAELYAQNKRDWASGNETQKNLATLNNQQIREAYGITQDVPLGEVERYIDALKTDNTKKSLITKITNPSVGNNVKASAEAVKNFSYNPANDPAYQSYVDAYTRQGQSAAKQTMANLAAANMGRNSSYGAAATAQVQQAYAKQATDMIPQLAQQAYARLMDKYSIDKDLEDTEYNRAFTGYQTLADDKTRQLTDEQLRLGNIGADINNQAAQIELAYLPTTLRQQVESGEITLADARIQLELNQKYSDTDRQLAQEKVRAEIAKAYRSGSGGSSSYKKQQTMADTDEAISNMLYSPLDGDGNYWGWFDANTAANVYVGYMAKDKIRDDATRKNIIDSLVYSGYTYDSALKKVDEYATNIARNILRREGKDWDDDAVKEYKDKWGMNYK